MKPTVFADTTQDMTIIREEIFGPVLAIMPFDTEEEAIALANDTPYGLAAYIQTGDMDVPRGGGSNCGRHDTGEWCQPDFSVARLVATSNQAWGAKAACGALKNFWKSKLSAALSNTN
ncbi:MAG: hypothetical protein CM15mP95_3130 [Alphaproteobacteria bacterium]|nr:MAG: hypothetical protein CM15mP95_3130 [Alphaproteobacteria bacterium]